MDIQPLLDWYAREKRDLPWRKTKDPYKIWISEIMLQQTRVDQVIPYYKNFLKRFPNVQVLAAAPQGQVLKAWEGLGYYSRARNLHKAAKEIVKTHNGKFPEDYETLSKLPGFGKYTTAAVLSIAFNQPHAVLDGNVIRVFSRLLKNRKDVTQTKVQTELRTKAQELLPENQASDYNQALMELGALICAPKNPTCEICPMHVQCRGYQELKDPSVLPNKLKKKPTPHFNISSGLVWDQNKLLITQRPQEKMLGGLWEFPGGKQEPNETLEQACAREIKEETGLEVTVQNKFAEVKHAYSHFKITLHVFECKKKSGTLTQGKWVPKKSLANYAFPRANAKVLEELALN